MLRPGCCSVIQLPKPICQIFYFQNDDEAAQNDDDDGDDDAAIEMQDIEVSQEERRERSRDGPRHRENQRHN